MSELFGGRFLELRYLQWVYPVLLALAFWGVLHGPSRFRSKPAVAALILLFAFSWPPASWLLHAGLEAPYRHADPAPPDIEAIVLFSGGSFGPQTNQPFTYLSDSTLLRCRTAARVHAASGAPVVVCGPGRREASPDAVWDLMSRQLEAWGVAERGILLEPHGRSTFEQARRAAELLRTMGVRRIAVVTEGFHMRRALGCLRREGFEVVAAPAGSRGAPDEIPWHAVLPSAETMRLNEDAIRELCALVVYKLRGRI